MTWRVIVITNQAKLSYKNGYMLIRNENTRMVHLSEINTLLIDSTAVVLTTHLLCELIKEKIKVVFCDEKRNPQSELVAYYGSHNTSKRLSIQIAWNKDLSKEIWGNIIEEKILNQAYCLKKFNKDGWEQLLEYSKGIEDGDITNREGHAAKVYFNSLFGNEFSRNIMCEQNGALDYGYTILLSNFNKEIVACGYVTQLGINHRNEFNYFNLSCDLMEPLRVIIDMYVYEQRDREMSKDYKFDLVNLLNKEVSIDGKKMAMTSAIRVYVQSVFRSLENNGLSAVKFIDIQ